MDFGVTLYCLGVAAAASCWMAKCSCIRMVTLWLILMYLSTQCSQQDTCTGGGGGAECVTRQCVCLYAMQCRTQAGLLQHILINDCYISQCSKHGWQHNKSSLQAVGMTWKHRPLLTYNWRCGLSCSVLCGYKTLLAQHVSTPPCPTPPCAS